MAATIDIYSRDLKTRIAQLSRFQLGERSWVLSGAGSCEFRIGLTEAKSTSAILHVGNMVFVRSDTGVPVWSGRIDELNFDNPDSISVFCNSRESLLRGRSGKNGSYSNVSELAQILLSPDTAIPGITVGTISDIGFVTGGPVTTDNTASLFDQVMLLAGKINGEWYVDHETGAFNFTKQIGADKSSLVQIEQSPDIIEHPQLKVNTESLIWKCTASTGDRENNWIFNVTIIDDEIRTFVNSDPREKNIWVDQKVLGSFEIGNNARDAINESLKNIITIDVSINNKRSLWQNIRLGDTIGISIFTLAFGIIKEKVRVFGFAVVNEESPQMRLVLKPLNAKDFFRYFK